VPRPSSGDYPDFASLREAWTRHDEAYVTYLRGITQQEFDSPRILDATAYTMGALIQHALNHSTYHRGQVALLLRQLGNTPPFTDYHDFLAEVRYLPAPVLSNQRCHVTRPISSSSSGRPIAFSASLIWP
jgi:uncharacterized damage-inducible protein DinB